MKGEFAARLLVAGMLGLFPLGDAAADKDDVPPPRRDPFLEVLTERIRSRILDTAGSRNYSRQNAEIQLQAHIKSSKHVISLTDHQLRKLELAGRGDIAAHFERYDQLKRELPTAEVTDDDLRQLERRIQEVEAARFKLFAPGSLYQKTLKSLIAAEEAEVDAMLSLPARDEVLRRWREKTRRIRTLEARFELVRYDSLLDLETQGLGRWMFEAPGAARLDLRPAHIAEREQSSRRNKAGRPFQLQPERSETWVRTGEGILRIDETNRTFQRFVREPAQAEPFADNDEPNPEDRLAFPLPQFFAPTQLIEMFFWKIAAQDDWTIRLQGTPSRSADARRITSIAVVLQRDSAELQTLEITDRCGTRETRFRFRDTRINQPPNPGSLPDPFHPPLEDYREIELPPQP